MRPLPGTADTTQGISHPRHLPLVQVAQPESGVVKAEPEARGPAVHEREEEESLRLPARQVRHPGLEGSGRQQALEVPAPRPRGPERFHDPRRNEVGAENALGAGEREPQGRLQAPAARALDPHVPARVERIDDRHEVHEPHDPRLEEASGEMVSRDQERVLGREKAPVTAGLPLHPLPYPAPVYPVVVAVPHAAVELEGYPASHGAHVEVDVVERPLPWACFPVVPADPLGPPAPLQGKAGVLEPLLGHQDIDVPHDPRFRGLVGPVREVLPLDRGMRDARSLEHARYPVERLPGDDARRDRGHPVVAEELREVASSEAGMLRDQGMEERGNVKVAGGTRQICCRMPANDPMERLCQSGREGRSQHGAEFRHQSHETSYSTPGSAIQ